MTTTTASLITWLSETGRINLGDSDCPLWSDLTTDDKLKFMDWLMVQEPVDQSDKDVDK